MDYHKHFYYIVFSNASQKLHPNNTLAEFTIHLARRIDLGSTDNWEVGLCEFSCPPALKSDNARPVDVIGDTNALIYCDLIAPQFVGNDNVGCLRTFIHPSKACEYIFKNVYYLPVERRTFQGINISIMDLKGKSIPFSSGAVLTKVILHSTPHSHL